MEEKILGILAQAIGTEAEYLEPDLDLFENGLLDSFGVINLLVTVEEELGIRIEPTELEREEISTPAKFTSCVLSKMQG